MSLVQSRGQLQLFHCDLPDSASSSEFLLSGKHQQQHPIFAMQKNQQAGALLEWLHSRGGSRIPCAFVAISPMFPGYLSTYALSPSRSPFKVSQPSLPSQFSLPLPITLRIAALAFPLHLSPTLSTCGP